MKGKLVLTCVTLTLMVGTLSPPALAGPARRLSSEPGQPPKVPFRIAEMVRGRPETGIHSQAAAADADKPRVQGPFVGEPVTPGESEKVRHLPTAAPGRPDEPVREVNPRQRGRVPKDGWRSAVEPAAPLVQETIRGSSLRTPTTTLSFDGIGFTGSVPPDPVGDVGPNHYVQMVNTHFAVFDKSGSQLAGPTAINVLWTGEGNACENRNDGDPIVLYDPLANRWLLSQFAKPSGSDTSPWYMCIAVSQTPDPTGAYHLYAFQINDHFPDYPKFGVWPDAYYMSSNDGFSNVGAYAFDRTNMLAGNAATYQKFSATGNFMLPGDLDGPTPPPAGSPGYFYTVMDDTFWPSQGFPGADRLEIWEFDADFGTPANSTFTRTLTLSTTSFDYLVCDFFEFACIPQPSPGEKLDALAEWPMWRLQYRNFGSHESLVGNFTVDVDGTSHAGIRWFELRKTGSGAWSIFQEGTHAPDANHRWLGSAAMDKDGNIALGYSVASASLNPSIRYTARLATDAPGTLGQEATLVTGGGVQSDGYNRWGDYSSMNVDPADGCTFWYTNEYYQTISSYSWKTRIGAFKIPSCTASPEPAWDKQVSVNGKPVADTLSPIAVVPGDSIQVVDRVYITHSHAVTFTLSEEWSESLQLALPVTPTIGEVVSDTNSLTWRATGVATDTWHSLTKTYRVNGDHGWHDYITETLTLDGRPEPVVVALRFVIPARIAKQGPDWAYPGSVIPYTLVIETAEPLSGTFVLSDALPAGVAFAGALTVTYGTAWYSETANAVYWTNPISARAPVSLSERFEGGVMPPAGWTVIQAPTSGKHWQLVDTGDDPNWIHSGTYAAWVNYEVADQDEWLISPEIDLRGQQNPMVEFWVYANNNWVADAEMQFLVIDSGGAFTDTLWRQSDESWSHPSQYRKLQKDLSAYATSPIRLAWRYVGNDGDSVALDDVLITATPVSISPVNVTFNVTVTANPGDTLINIADLNADGARLSAGHALSVSGPKASWEQRTYVNGILTDTFPATVFPGDVVDVVDRVYVTFTTNISYTLVETWTESLELAGGTFDVGDAVRTGRTLRWDVVNAAPNNGYAITSTFHVTGSGWISDTITEELRVEHADRQLDDRVLVFWHGGVCQPVSGVDFDWAPFSPQTGEVVTFTPRLQPPTATPPITYEWRFGDGGTSGGNPAYHTFAISDTYSVSITGTNECGGPVWSTHDVAVTGEPFTPTHGVELGPLPTAKSGDPGTSIVYTLTLRNTGNAADTFHVSSAGDEAWPTHVVPDQANLGPGSTTQVKVTVNIPIGATSSDVATIIATSLGDPSVSASTILTTTVFAMDRGVSISVDDDSLWGYVGQTVTYTLAVQNDGEGQDRFNASLSGHAWTTISSTAMVGPLAAGATGTLEVYVTIPVTATDGATDTVLVTVASIVDPSASDTRTLITAAREFKLYLPLVLRGF